MQILFAFTLLVSATLLFLVQPMFAKMVLPRLGGTPAVWNTCMVFYQAMLLAGYLYAHLATRWLGVRRQAIVHLVLLCLPWLVLPIGIATHGNPPEGQNPIPWLLLLMTVAVGIPFFVVSASAPMLQAWFADTGHPAGRDPYFLYAASNLGSMAALLGYPLLYERYLPLAGQSFWWAIGYGVLMTLTVACAVVLWRSPRPSGIVPPPAPEAADAAGASEVAQDRPTFGRRMRWLALAFAPSSLLLGVTNFISIDVAAVPLLWVIPLALYLLTFVLVFARWKILPHHLMVLVQPIFVGVLAVVFFQSSSSSMQWLVLLHLATFFVCAMVCHGELAASRPGTSHLTEFYLWMSVGGVLGGLFNALVAPFIFPTVIEYPLVVAIACLLRPRPTAAKHPVIARWLDLVLPLVLYSVLWGLFHFRDFLGLVDKLPTLFGCAAWSLDWSWSTVVSGVLEWIHTKLLWINNVPTWFGRNAWQWIQVGQWQVTSETAVIATGALLALVFVRRPVRYGTAVGLLLLFNLLWFNAEPSIICTNRSFFGVLRVREEVTDLDNGLKRVEHTLYHGSTIHGNQRADLTQDTADPRERWAQAKKSDMPTTYYFPTGPVGQVFDKLTDPERTKEIGVIGLGTGSTATYARPRQSLTYFDIDPVVKRIAEDRRLFTYVKDAEAKGATVEILVADARLSLEKWPTTGKNPNASRRFDILLVDAFSSDAIPVHLLTREAIQLYFTKLADHGVLMVHISNRHLDLAPVVGNIAESLGLVCRRNSDSVSSEDRQEGKYESDWIVVARTEKDLGPLGASGDWEPIPPDDRVGLWTDDYSNIVAVLRWFRHDAEESTIEDDDEEF